VRDATFGLTLPTAKTGGFTSSTRRASIGGLIVSPCAFSSREEVRACPALPDCSPGVSRRARIDLKRRTWLSPLMLFVRLTFYGAVDCRANGLRPEMPKNRRIVSGTTDVRKGVDGNQHTTNDDDGGLISPRLKAGALRPRSVKQVRQDKIR
jgi:hypothetical protein